MLTSDAAQRIGRLLVEDDGHDDASTPVAPSPHFPARPVALIIFLGIALVMLHAAHTTGSLGARARVSPADPNGRPEELPMPQSVTSAAMASVVALSVATSGHAQDAVQWRVEDGGNGHWYALQLSATVLYWQVAQDAAMELGGHLATVTTDEEDQFAFALTEGLEAWNGPLGPWLGGIQVPGSGEPVGEWRWVTGEAFGWSNWLPPNPDNGGAVGNEDRLHYIDRTRGWNDVPQNYQPAANVGVRSFIIEWSADCNADGIVDYGQIRAGDLADTNGNNIPDCCESLSDACAGDLVRDGRVDGVDLAAVLNNWGLSEGAALNADANCDGVVDGQDLATVLGSWGKCP